ncbi:MAG TPA: DUF2341 domain-containing protein, partial [Bryobacteraceae bacterium]|nr:DUF2341 domain-containing protein [Bryobacteraceae bacterium]
MSYFGGKSRSKATWLIGACAIALTGAAQLRATDPAWYNTSWSNRKPITISHLQVSGTSNLTNFPMLFSVTDANLKTVASGGSVGQANGNDILFTASDGVTKLNHEIETYNGATGQLIAWVQISTLSPTADTVIYAYFGNASAANQQNGTGVWDSNYKAVWHLPNGSTLSATDSTSNANNGTPTNSPAATSGEIDGAASFNGSSSYVAVPDSASLALSGSLTVSAWVKAANTTSKQHILSRWNGPYNYELYTNGDCAGGTAFGMSVSVVGSPRSDACANGTVDTNWHKLDGVYDGAHVSIYVDGALRTSTAVSGALQSAAGSNVGIGAWYGTPAFFFNGLVDEARISNTNRSADWIKTEYNNQGSAATFYSVGGLQGQGGGGSGPAWYNTSWSNRKPITVDPTKVLGGSNLANFPMLFSVTDVNLKTVANGGSVGQANGNDILFTASDGTTKLNHEIESYNGATGQLIAWVQIPTVSASANTVLYVYYGNASAANQQNGTAVWDSSYRAVWHLGNGASIALSDSSSNGNALTNTGMTAVSGQINGGANSIGSSTYGFSGTPSSAYNLSDWTYSTWAKVAAIPNPQGQNNVLFAVGAKELDIDTGGHLTAVVATSMSYRARTSSGTVSTGAWHHVAATFSSADNLWHLYLDGAEMSYSSSGTGSGTNNSDTVFAIGTSGYNNYYGNYNGSLDEMRIAAVQRSAGWIGTEYNNQSSPGTFYSVGAQQSPGGGGGSGSAWYNTSWSNRKLLTVDHTKVVGGSNLTNFPVLVSVADANLKTVANGGGVGQ